MRVDCDGGGVYFGGGFAEKKDRMESWAGLLVGSDMARVHEAKDAGAWKLDNGTQGGRREVK